MGLGKSLGKGLTSVATGGLSNAWDALKGGTQTVSQGPLETPEQTAARKKLLDFATTGRFGNFTAGENAGLGYGDFDATGYEKQGLSTLGNLLSSGIPEEYRMGDLALQDLLQTSPEAIDAQFSPFKALASREIQSQADAVKRNAGFGGNLFSSNTYRQLNDVGTRGNEILTQRLAELANQYQDRKLQAIPLAYQSAQGKENMALNRVAASQQYGSLIRNLNTQNIQARDAEILRRRQEMQLPINAAQSVINAPVQFGVQSMEVPKANPFMDVLQIAASIGGRVAGGR